MRYLKGNVLSSLTYYSDASNEAIKKTTNILLRQLVQGDTKERERLKNATKIEEIQEKKLLTENEPLQLAF